MKLVLSFLMLGAAFSLGACSSSSSSKKPADKVGTEGSGSCDNSGVDASTYMSGIVAGQKLGMNNPVSSRLVNLYFESDEGYAICTGSLLPGNVVLTAGHCAPSSPDKLFVVIFNNNLNCLTGDNVKTLARQVTDYRVNPAYFGSTSDRDNDLTLLHFDGTVPYGYTTFDFPTGDVQIAPSDKLIMSGYGVTNYNNDDGGVLRITSLPGSRVTHDEDSPKSLIVDQHDTGVCSGDSGSPLMVYKNGKLSIVGVTSTVINREGNRDKACNDLSSFVDVSKQQYWLKTTYDALRDNK